MEEMPIETLKEEMVAMVQEEMPFMEIMMEDGTTSTTMEMMEEMEEEEPPMMTVRPGPMMEESAPTWRKKNDHHYHPPPGPCTKTGRTYVHKKRLNKMASRTYGNSTSKRGGSK